MADRTAGGQREHATDGIGTAGPDMAEVKTNLTHEEFAQLKQGDRVLVGGVVYELACNMGSGGGAPGAAVGVDLAGSAERIPFDRMPSFKSREGVIDIRDVGVTPDVEEQASGARP